jgi:hypothetical protein
MNLFERFAAATAIAASVSAAEPAAAGQTTTLVVGSAQTNGGACFNMPIERMDKQGNLQQAGTRRLCTDPLGQTLGSVSLPANTWFNPNVACVVEDRARVRTSVACPALTR